MANAVMPSVKISETGTGTTADRCQAGASALESFEIARGKFSFRWHIRASVYEFESSVYEDRVRFEDVIN